MIRIAESVGGEPGHYSKDCPVKESGIDPWRGQEELNSLGAADEISLLDTIKRLSLRVRDRPIICS